MLMNRPRLVATTAAVLCLFAARARAAELEKVDVFRAGDGGYAVYRIPGVVVTGKGTLLAYCEARKSSSSDWGEIDVLVRRSTDGGRTWGPAREVAGPPADAKKNPVAAAKNLGRPGEITVNNPVAIADAHTALVHFLYCVEYARCFYVRSDDDGATFSAPVEITSTFDAFRPEYDWKVLATGPGHGVRLKNGRLVVPVWLSTGAGGHAHRPSCVATVYSDDGGKAWRRGDVVVNHPELTNPSETAVAELGDGRLMLNIRHEGDGERKIPTWRAVTVGPDGATGWGKVKLDESLPEPVCMGALLGVDTAGGRSLLFANPHNAQSRERRNLVVRRSDDDGQTWRKVVTVEGGAAGYSDLAAGPDGTVYCLYERGGGGTAFKPDALTLARFRLE